MFTFLLFPAVHRGGRSSWRRRKLSVYCSYISRCLYFIFEYVTAIIRSCWSNYVPHCFGCIPSDFTSAHVDVIELNWVVLTWSCRDVDEVSGASSNRPPPSCFAVD